MEHTAPSLTDPIGVFDSGIGGLTVANAILGLRPQEKLCYLADNARAPYGQRSVVELRRFSFEITDWLLGQGAKIIVAACNTAVSAALTELRAARPGITFVGMEPALKPAALLTRTGKIAVLATAATLASDRFYNLSARFATGLEVHTDPCLGLVRLIEDGRAESEETRALLRTITAPLTAAGVDTVVLGCTHYPLVAAELQRQLGPGVTLVDPAPAAARRTIFLLEELGLANPDPLDRPVHHLNFTGPRVSLPAGHGWEALSMAEIDFRAGVALD
ncbi:MAG: glutamate racemase [Saprospiraceae bacterium]